MADITCLQTKVRNMTGGEAFFGFLPPHGKKLAAGEEYTFFGGLDSLLASITRKRHRTALQSALESGDIVIVQSPTPHFYDATLDVTKVLAVQNSVVNDVDPCWGEYSSSITDPHTV